MFFVRTQREHEWRSPSYKFTERQFRKFEQMIEAVEQVVGEEESQDV